MQLTAIAAVARNGVIGVAGALPWHIPEDFARFKQVTMGSNLIMGRKTFESIGGALKGRISIVVTSRPGPAETLTPAECGAETRLLWVSSLDEALAAADPAKPTFIGGGGQLYREAWPLLTDLDITQVDRSPAGDTYFPEISPDTWRETWREPHDGFCFVNYTRA
ncbi:MAG: dihydrofolate reductase [Propionibacteriaceae bacterium]|nr:dihydrofolate reductase [Propionibacteriaceae bacterium]